MNVEVFLHFVILNSLFDIQYFAHVFIAAAGSSVLPAAG
jgi:hypothetical protein